MKVPASNTLSSLRTYSSWLMAVARIPVPSRAVPVLVIKLGWEGSFSMSSLARSLGGWVDMAARRTVGPTRGRAMFMFSEISHL